jgi:hypothetical protein
MYTYRVLDIIYLSAIGRIMNNWTYPLLEGDTGVARRSRHGVPCGRLLFLLIV